MWKVLSMLLSALRGYLLWGACEACRRLERWNRVCGAAVR
jgi:hypothetical protein